jgi:LacI family transcriptional regulator
MKKRNPNNDLPQRANLAMVAARAGVSPATVSRILNGSARVSETKRNAVQSVIAELQFRPDPAARSLAGGRTMSVGVLTQFIDSPFYGEALRGIEDTLQEHQYVPLFASGHWNDDDERARIALLIERKVDALIVLTGRLSEQTLVETARKIPVVVTGRQLVANNLFSIDFDNEVGSRLAVRHLVGLGHQKIAFISGPADHPDAQQRLFGYQAELRARGILPDDQLLGQGNFQEAGGKQAMNAVLQRGVPFSAVIAANDQMAYGARLALHVAGLRVPEDVSLVGFDDLPHSAFTLPPLTTVRQPVYEIGKLAAETALMLLNGAVPEPLIIEAQLVARESTRIARH